MPTTQQVADRANIHPNTVRKYSSQYAALLSPGARGEDGARLFSEDDADVICEIAALRNTKMPAAEIIAKLQEDAAPSVIDVAPTEPTRAPHDDHTEATQTPHAIQPATQTPHAVMLVRDDLQRQIDAIHATQRIQLRNATLHGALLGAIAALAAGAFVLWVLYLLAG